MAKPLQSVLKWIYTKFSEDTSKMLIATSAIGWLTSMVAQVIAIVVNPKIKEEQKVFLIPQEFNDALVNIGTYLLITVLTKKTVSKLFSTGKLLPKSVKEHISKNPKLFEGKLGNVQYDIGKILEGGNKDIYHTYKVYKNIGTTVATIGAGILAANVITPIERNRLASRVQKRYINEFIKPDSNNKTNINPDNSNENHIAVPTPKLESVKSSNSMRI